MTRYRLIVNPVAGGGTARRAVPVIERMLIAYGMTFDILYTERPWHAVSLARRAVVEGYDVVVAVGGDGTANEVLNGLMQAKLAGEGSAALGILCAGSGNDFAFGVGLPDNLEAGCKHLFEDRRRAIDVGRVEGDQFPEARFFGNGVGIGFDAVVGFEAAKLKHLRGFLGYLVAALKTIFLYFRAPQVRIEYGEEAVEQRSLMISVMNGRRLGGGFMMAPEAEIDDGLLDLNIVREIGRARIFTLMLRFMKGTQAGQPEIRSGRTQRITVTTTNGVLPAHADGETLCEEGNRLTMELLPQQIEVLSQRPAGER